MAPQIRIGFENNPKINGKMQSWSTKEIPEWIDMSYQQQRADWAIQSKKCNLAKWTLLQCSIRFADLRPIFRPVFDIQTQFYGGRDSS